MLIKNKVQNLGVAVIATLVGAAFFGSTAFAYGPERQTFTAENPADHVTFNSITNNPTVGDERNFVRVRQVGSAQFVDSVDIWKVDFSPLIKIPTNENDFFIPNEKLKITTE